MPTPCTRLLLLIPFLLALCRPVVTATDRAPACAGQFYPASPAELRATLTELFRHAAREQEKGDIEALILPHAGYIFSGGVAAAGVAQVNPRQQIDNIFLIGVSHHAAYSGAAVYAAGDFLTPLGRVPVNMNIARTLLNQRDLFLENDRAHAVDHSLEVQLPLLQFHLQKPFRIVPILLGTSDLALCTRIAQVLKPYCTAGNLFVISTDLSHYPSYREAVTTDRRTIKAVLSGSTRELLRTIEQNERAGISHLATSMCGLGGVLLLQEIVGTDNGGRFSLVQYRNSGDAAVGEKSRVVGYASIVVTRPESESFLLSPDDKRQLLVIARSTLAEYLQHRRLPDLSGDRLSAPLRTPCGAFVTLRKQGELRGCVGNFSGMEELARTVQKLAVAAATEDHRFTPVTAGELKSLSIEISALSPMRRVVSPKEITLGKHGIYIRKGDRTGTFLPQVALETGWSLDEFLGHCARDKAGIGWDGWKDAELFVYEAIVFGEPDHAGQR